MREVERIENQMQRAFAGEAWHGPALLVLLDGVTAATAAAKPIGQAHSIWEIVLHISTWKEIVRKRLEHEAADPPSSVDWPPVEDAGEKAWQEAQDRLKMLHEELRLAVLRLDDRRLEEKAPGRDYSLYVMLHGLVQHDLYHAGQIALLRKASG